MHSVAVFRENDEWQIEVDESATVSCRRLVDILPAAADLVQAAGGDYEDPESQLMVFFVAGGSPIAPDVGASLIAVSSWQGGDEEVVVTKTSDLGVHMVWTHYVENLSTGFSVLSSPYDLDQLNWVVPALQDGARSLTALVAMKKLSSHAAGKDYIEAVRPVYEAAQAVGRDRSAREARERRTPGSEQ